MRTTSDYVWVAILIPLAVWLLTRSGGFQSATYKRANFVAILAWIAVILLGLWVARRIILPNIFD